MSEEIFRKKNLNKARAPEKVDAFIQSCRARYGLLVIALCLLVAGFAAWLLLSSADVKISTYCVVSEGTLQLYISEEDAEYVSEGQTVKTEAGEYTIAVRYDVPCNLYEEDASLAHMCGLAEDDWCYIYEADCNLEDGLYQAEVVTASFRPFELLFAKQVSYGGK